MPPLNSETGEIEKDLGLTPATTPIADTDAPADAGDKDAPPPSSGQDETTEANEPKSMAEAIAQALAGDEAKPDEGTDDPDKPKPDEGADDPDKPKADDPAAKAPEDKSKQPAEGSADTDEDDPSDDELKAYQPRVQKRIRKLLSQRNEARQQAATLETDAGHYRNIRQFMADSQLQDGEVAELFKVGRLLKSNDPQGLEQALDIVLPIAQQLLEATGRSLPRELREKVEAGELTEDHAREMARQRSRADLAEKRASQAETTRQTSEQRQAETTLGTAIQTAVHAWETRTRQSDPDFGLKADALRDASLALVAEKGRPKNPEEAVQFAQQAYDRVNSWFKAVRPAPKPSRPAPSGGQNGNRSGLQPAPKSLEEAIRGAMAGGQ